MEESVLYRNIENITLKRDKMLKKLRRKVELLRRNELEPTELRPIIREVGRLRRALLKAVKDSSSMSISREYKELIDTLFEFSLMVSVEDEEELLREVKSSLEGNGNDELKKDVLRELSNVKELKNELSRYLNSSEEGSRGR